MSENVQLRNEQFSGVRDKHKTHQPEICGDAWLRKQTNTRALMFLSQYIWATSHPPPPITPLVIRDDATLPPPQVLSVMWTWCDMAVHLGENAVAEDQHLPGFWSQESGGQRCGELLCLGAWVSEFLEEEQKMVCVGTAGH